MLTHVALAGAWLLVGIVSTSTFFLARDYLKPRTKDHAIMAVIAAFQPLIDADTAAAASLTASAAAIATLLANPALPEGAASAQDVSDTLAALTTASGSVTTEAAAVAAAIPAPAEPAA